MFRGFQGSPRLWFSLFTVWFIVLNFLSHGDRFQPASLSFFEFPHADKIAHFGYFFGGGGLLSAAIFFWKEPRWPALILIVTIVLGVVGAWDEYHQSFFLNRTGNDLGDWAADTFGAFCGSLVFRKTLIFSRRLDQNCPQVQKIERKI